MKTLKTLAAVAIVASTATTVSAGGLAPVIATPQVTIVDTPAPSGSISPGLIVLGVLGALVAASASF